MVICLPLSLAPREKLLRVLPRPARSLCQFESWPPSPLLLCFSLICRAGAAMERASSVGGAPGCGHCHGSLSLSLAPRGWTKLCRCLIERGSRGRNSRQDAGQRLLGLHFCHCFVPKGWPQKSPMELGGWRGLGAGKARLPASGTSQPFWGADVC